MVAIEIIHRSCGDIHLGAQVGHDHGGILDIPGGPSLSYGRVPNRLAIALVSVPENEIAQVPSLSGIVVT